MSKKPGVSKVLNKVDMFGDTFTFNINGRNNITSSVGGVLTIILFIATSLLIGYNIYNWVKNSDPIVNISLSYRNTIEVVTIGKDSIELGMGLVVLEGNNNPRQFTISGNNMKNTKRDLFGTLGTEVQVVGKMNPCPNLAVSNNTNSTLAIKLFNRYNELSSNILCSDIPLNSINSVLDSSNTTKLSGNYNATLEIVSDTLNKGKVFDFMTNTVIDLCSIDSRCTDEKYMSTKNKGSTNKLLIFYKDTFFDVFSTKGSSSALVTEVIDIDYTVNYNVVFTVKRNTVYTNRNIFLNFNQDEEETFYSLVVNVWPKTKPETDKKTEMKVNLSYILDKQDQIYRRSYKQIDSLIADTYAMYGFFLFACQICISIFDVAKVDFYLFNKLYCFIDSKDDVNNNDKDNNSNEGNNQDKNVRENKVLFANVSDFKNKSTNKEKNINTNNNNINNISSKSNNNLNINVNNSINNANVAVVGSERKDGESEKFEFKLENEIKEKEVKESKNSNIMKKNLTQANSEEKIFERNVVKLFLIEYLCCMKNSSYAKTYNEAKETLEYDLNILTILTKLIELEKIVDVLLDEKQKKVILDKKPKRFIQTICEEVRVVNSELSKYED